MNIRSSEPIVPPFQEQLEKADWIGTDNLGFTDGVASKDCEAIHDIYSIQRNGNLMGNDGTPERSTYL